MNIVAISIQLEADTNRISPRMRFNYAPPAVRRKIAQSADVDNSESTFDSEKKKATSMRICRWYKRSSKIISSENKQVEFMNWQRKSFTQQAWACNKIRHTSDDYIGLFCLHSKHEILFSVHLTICIKIDWLPLRKKWFVRICSVGYSMYVRVFFGRIAFDHDDWLFLCVYN